MGFWPTWNRYNAATKRRIPTFDTTLNSFIDIIHSAENIAIKEGNLHNVDLKGLYEILKIFLRSS